MTMQSLAREVIYPNFGISNNSSSGSSGRSAVTSGQYDCFIFRAKEAMTISHVALRCSTVSGSPSAVITIEGVNLSTGLPDGNPSAFGSDSSTTTATLTTTMVIHALANSATIAAGDYVAVKFTYNAGTSFAIGTFIGGFAGYTVLPYVVYNGTKAGLGITSLNIALGSSATSFYNVWGLSPLIAASGGVTTSVSTSTQDAIGIRFKIPFKGRLVGHINTLMSAAYGAFEYGVYDDSNNELSSSRTTGYDPDAMGAQANGSHMIMALDNAVTLSPDTWYRYLLWPTTTTAFVIHGYGALDANLKAIQPGGTNWHYVKKAVGGAWTDSLTTDAFVINLIFDQLSDDVGSGGGTYFSVGG